MKCLGDSSLAFLCSIMVLLSGGLLWGCGYHLAADGKPMGIQMDSIAIPMISSTSSQEEFEAIFTKVIRQEFKSDLAFQRSVFSQVNLTHAPFADLFYDPVMRDSLTYHVSRPPSYVSMLTLWIGRGNGNHPINPSHPVLTTNPPISR